MSAAQERVGLLKIRSCCLFTWHEPADKPGTRVVYILPEHCDACIAVLKTVKPAVELVD